MLAPFRGVRYAPERVSGMAEVTSPPYDVLGAAAAERLRSADPHNVVRLTLPADGDGEPDSRYGVAAQTLRKWIADGVLVPDPEASLYVYEERAGEDAGSWRGTWPGLQRGLIGAIALASPAAGIVLPHEGVTPVVVADQRRLMEATGANLEPIFLVYEGGGRASQLVDEVAETQLPTIEAVTDGVTHRLWAVTDPVRVAAAAADLAERHAVIADGHHRYAAYLELRAQRHADGHGSGPWDYGLALLVDLSAYPPRIDPIHRVITNLLPTTAAELARSAFTVRALPHGIDLGAALRALAEACTAGEHAACGRTSSGPTGWDGTGLDGTGPGQIAGSRASGRGTAFLLAGDGGFHLLTHPDPVKLAAAAPSGRSERWRRLDTSVLHELLIREIWRIRDDQSAVQMVHNDPAVAIEAAAPGGTAVICNPPQVAEVLALAASGEQMPRKSTSFGPKPRTGLVIRSFAYG